MSGEIKENNCKPTKLSILIKMLESRWVTALDSAQNGGPMALSQRCGDLRVDGYKIRDKWVKMKSGSRVKAYTLAKGIK